MGNILKLGIYFSVNKCFPDGYFKTTFTWWLYELLIIKCVLNTCKQLVNLLKVKHQLEGIQSVDISWTLSVHSWQNNHLFTQLGFGAVMHCNYTVLCNVKCVYSAYVNVQSITHLPVQYISTVYSRPWAIKVIAVSTNKIILGKLYIADLLCSITSTKHFCLHLNLICVDIRKRWSPWRPVHMIDGRKKDEK